MAKRESNNGYTVTKEVTPEGIVHTNYEADGNLEQTNQLDCIALKDVKNHYTPVDLAYAIPKCALQGDYAKAADLAILFSMYSNFDIARVSDRSAHQAKEIILMSTAGQIGFKENELIDEGTFEERVDRHS